MRTIKFTADLEPVPFPRPASNGKRRYNPPRYSTFKDVIGHLAKIAMKGQAPFTGAIKLTADVYVKREPTSLNSGDWDNHGKAISDALSKIVYGDDRQIVDGHIRLFKGEPKIIICVEELTNGNDT